VILGGELVFAPFGLEMFGPLMPIYTLACATLILACLAPGPAAALLGLRPVAYVGRLSYSLHLWHVPILIAFGIIGSARSPGGTPSISVLAVLCSLLAAAVSYHLVRATLLRHRRRQTGPRPTTTTPALAQA
jgi:peptidoglycan/LPS O-acetylase OafA/YrhL